MSITLLSATGVNVVYDLVKSSGQSQVFQNIGSSFVDTRLLTQAQNVGNSGTGKSRFVLKIPYTFTVPGSSVVQMDYMYFNIGATIPETAPLAEADKGVFQLKTLMGLQHVADLITRRKFTAS